MKEFTKMLRMITIVAVIGFSTAACDSGTGGNPAVISTYTVTFNSNGGSEVNPITNIERGAGINTPPAPVKGTGYAFDKWYRDTALTIEWNFGSDTVTGNITLYAKWNLTLDIGDIGPGGGKIFYRSAAGFTMADDGSTACYLEAAPTGMSELAWGPVIGSGGTDTSIGTGRKNTAFILAEDAAAPAALASRDYSNNGKTDWFLPSKDELDQLYTNRSFVGGLTPDSIKYYWSSSQHDNVITYVWYQDFYGGACNFYQPSALYYSHAIRAF